MSNGLSIKYIYDLKGLSRTNPLLALTFAIVLFSLAGIPPLAGFYSKLLLFMSAVHSSLYVIAILGLILSVISAMYYIRMITIMYFDTTIVSKMPYSQDECKGIDLINTYILGICLLLLILLFIFPQPLLNITYAVTLSIHM